MKNPSQALIWSAFSLSWQALAMQIVAAVSAIFLLDLALDPGIDTRIPIETADLVLIISISMLYLVAVNRRQNPGRKRSSLGFPYRIEFSHPVATSTLTFVPLFFFCALTQVALFAPILIVNLLFLDVEISFLPISFITFQFTIFPLMLAWWTQNGLASLVSWLVTFALYVYGFLIPEFTRVENTWIFEVDSAAAFIYPLLCTSVMLVVTFLGVRQQRSGEILFNFGQGRLAKGETGALRDRFPLPIARCPIESPMKAEIWKERQLNGEYHAVFGGLVGAGITLAILGIIDFFVPGEDTVQFANVMVLTLGVYFAVCVGLTVSMFGVRYKNGVASVSVHAKTTPLNTPQLTFVRMMVALRSTLIAGFVTAVVVWILGSFLIEDFQEIRVAILESFTFLAEAGIAGGMLRITLILLAFLTCLSLFALFLSWTMLHSQKMTIAYALIFAYVFLVANGLSALFKGSEDFNLIVDTVVKSHLWLFILLIPVATVTMLRGLLLDGVINKTLLTWMLVIGCVLQGLNLLWVFGGNNYNALSLDITITALSYLVMQGFLPLLAAAFALWTANRLRHG